jgi:hypothetical protein
MLDHVAAPGDATDASVVAPASTASRIPTTGDHRLVVTSIGRATPGLHQALAKVLPFPSQTLLARLYQAPSILLDEISPELGHRIAQVLREAGLEVAIEPGDAPFEAGVGDREVALHVSDPSRFRAAIVEVAAFLGCAPARATQLLWQSPAVLVGRVSEATVAALRQRLEPLGVELDVSTPDTARYDVLVADTSPGVRARVIAALRAEGLTVEAAGPLAALGITRAQADAVWRRLDRGVPVRLLDHAFQRFDVRLDAAPDTPVVRERLVQATGMPASVAVRVLQRLPVVLHQGIRHAEVPARLQALAEVGARATAHLVTFQSFDVVVEHVADLPATAAAIASLVEAPIDELAPELRRLPLRLPGPFSALRARCLRHELHAVGARVRLEER